MRVSDSIPYDIQRLDQTLLDAKEDDLLVLMKELTPAQEESYYLNKIFAMHEYVSDGTAVIFIALMKGEVVGYIWGYERRDVQAAAVHVTQLVVNMKYRGCGIGKSLMNRMKKWASEHNLTGIELNVSPSNDSGIRFYKKNGFVYKRLFMTYQVREVEEKL